LVRSYAGVALGATKSKSHLKALEYRGRIERYSIARIGILAGMHALGHRKALREIIHLLRNRRYRARCAAANTLGALVNKANAKTILTALESSAKREKTVAAKSSFLSNIKSARALIR
jgi:HEAT repeat protein